MSRSQCPSLLLFLEATLHWCPRWLMRTVLFAVMLIGLSGVPSAADPIQIRSGRIVFTDEPGTFAVAGNGFDVSFGWAPAEGWSSQCGAGCVSGTTVDFSG